MPNPKHNLEHSDEGNSIARPSVASISNFLENFRHFIDRWGQTHTDHFKARFDRMQITLKSIFELTEESSRVNATGYSVFSVIRIEHREDETHTPFLADLLNPRGTHKQRFLFLREFLEMCAKKPGFPLPQGDIVNSLWYIDTQCSTAYGTLDLVLTCPGLRYMIVVENKIDAREQPEQLKRYSDWMKTYRHSYDSQSLIYLTPAGDKSDTAAGGPYVRLSYRVDIVNILRRCLPRIAASVVAETVRQYITLIESF